MNPVVPTSVTDAVAWAVIALFATGWFFEKRRPDLARRLAAGAWVGFAGFWLLLVPRYALVMRAPIEVALGALAVPACLYAGYLLWSGRDSLFTLSRAVALMGIFYLPFDTIPFLRQALVEGIAYQVHAVIAWLGYDATLIEHAETGYRSAIAFGGDDHRYVTHIVLACTGIGSTTIFGGLIAALDAPLSRKVRAFALAAGVIYVLNIARNVFIAVAFGQQWFQVLVGPVMAVTGYTDPGLVSFFIADRVLSQGLAILALVSITWVVVRTVPEFVVVVEEALYVVTRREYDLHAALATDAGDR